MGIIRLFLAVAVVLEHFSSQVLRNRDLPLFDIAIVGNINGARAVLLFYVISGFLVSYALNHKYTQDRDGTLAFYRSRFLRIYPLWWALLIIIAVLSTTPQITLPAAILFGLDWIVPFWHYPDRYWDVLSGTTAIAWTLGAELTFYLFAPWLLRRNWIALSVLLASFALRAFIHNKVDAGDPAFATLTFFFFPATVMFFMLGHFGRVISSRYPIKLTPSLVLLVISIVLFWSISPRISIDVKMEYVAVACFALALPGIFAATKDNNISNYIGDLTYPLYITHSLTISMLFWPIGLVSGFGEHMTDGYLLPNTSKMTAAAILTIITTIAVVAVAALALRFVEPPARRVGIYILSRVFSRKTSPLADEPLAPTPSTSP